MRHQDLSYNHPASQLRHLTIRQLRSLAALASNYPGWPDGEQASVFDPVAEVFYRVSDDSGWRRESYDARSTPSEERVRRRFTASDYLERGR